MIQRGIPSHSAGYLPILAVILGVAALYLGCRGFQERGIVVWHRTGEESRIAGWPGRAIGAVLLAFGAWFVWSGLAMMRGA